MKKSLLPLGKELAMHRKQLDVIKTSLRRHNSRFENQVCQVQKRCDQLISFKEKEVSEYMRQLDEIKRSIINGDSENLEMTEELRDLFYPPPSN